MKNNRQSATLHAIRKHVSRSMGMTCVLLASALAGTLAGCQSAPVTHGLNASQIQALEQAGFHEVDGGWELGLDDRVLFDVDKSDVLPGAKTTIGRLGQTLTKVDIRHVRVYGYTDSTGSDDYNDKLSRRRANSVSDVLVDAGMPRDGIVTAGKGKQDPVADNATVEGRAQNRRVAIVVTTP